MRGIQAQIDSGHLQREDPHHPSNWHHGIMPPTALPQEGGYTERYFAEQYSGDEGQQADGFVSHDGHDVAGLLRDLLASAVRSQGAEAARERYGVAREQYSTQYSGQQGLPTGFAAVSMGAGSGFGAQGWAAANNFGALYGDPYAFQ